MPHALPSRYYGRRALICAVPAVLIYAVMIQVTLAHLGTVAGLPPFDMRPTGYATAEARALLTALGAEGRYYYLTRQIPLDLLYPGLMAGAMAYTLLWLRVRQVLRIGVALAIAAGLADYCENAGIVVMLIKGPAASSGLVAATSMASMAKAGLTTIAASLVLIVALYRGLTVLCRNQTRRRASRP